jgi:hypothetical protein
MIVEIPQPITCFISTKTEINRDHAVPCARALLSGRARPLTVTTRH